MGTEGAAKVWHLSSSDDPAEDYQLSALQWKDLSLPQPTGEEKKQFRDAGDVSSHGFPHREERKGKNDKETHPFRDQQSARYWKLSSPKYYNINTSPLTFCTPKVRESLLLAPPICSSYSRILHDKDQKINTILRHGALHLPLLHRFSYCKWWACGICALLEVQKPEFSFHSSIHLSFIAKSCTNLT